MSSCADTELLVRAAASHAAALRGDLDDVKAVLDGLAAHGGDMCHAWHAALAARAHMLRPDRFRAPERQTVAAFTSCSPPARVLACLALAELERRSVLDFAAAELEDWLDLHQRLLAGVSEADAAEARLWLETGRYWARLLRGETVGFEAAGAAREKVALAAQAAALVVEVSAMRSLAAALDDDHEGGLALARRASRMARTEALPQQEFLAHLVLARARRLQRHPHLALRILTALAPLVSEPFRPWLTWELLMAGDLDESRRLLVGIAANAPAARAAHALMRVQEAAVAGVRDVFDAAAAELLEHTQGAAFAWREAEILLAALDHRAAGPAAIARWRDGGSALPSPEIHGLCVRGRDEKSDDTSEAYVLAQPGAAPRRILGLGAALCDRETIRLRRTRRQQGRVETMAAIVALAGSAGIEAGQAFQAAYEFPYEPDIHRTVFEVLLHRVRTYLEGAAELVRGEGVLRLELSKPVLVPDPRCAPQAYDRLLRILAHEGRATAREAAEQAGLSLRAVQIALKELADSGACSSEKQGQQVVFVVEDTTFSEPTRRLRLPR